MNKFLSIKILVIIIIVALIFGLSLLVVKYFQPKQNLVNQPPVVNQVVNNNPEPIIIQPKLALPLDQALSRVTKKPFGIYITPKNSPISPEKFSGYHTGVDFEIFPNEENKDITVSAVCVGKLLLKKYAAGYGGVAVELCKLDNQDVTIIYGHLKLSSIDLKVDQAIAAGEKIGILGKGYSSETDGERKHLHLGVHKGSTVNLLGYVQDKNLLSDWFNALDYLK